MSDKRIGKLARIGALWTTGSRIGYYVLFIITSIVLARILTPEEFGLMVIINLTTVFVKHFFEFGLSYAFIQEKDVDQDDASTFFFLQIALNIIIWLAICAVSPFAAAYYDQPLLVYYLPVTGFGYVIDSLNRVPMTMMARELDYRLNSIIGLLSAFLGSATAIAMALSGFGIWSMIADYLVNVAAATVIVYLWYPWRPQWVFKLESAKRLLNFGKWMLLKSLVGYVNKNLDYFIVSRLLGLTALGHYERAFNLMRTPQKLITNSISGVLFSAFSRIQDEQVRVKKAFRKVVMMISLFSYPILLGMLVLAEEFILVVYGDQWIFSIMPLRVMCLAGIFLAIDPLLGSVITSSGYVKYTAYRKVIEVFILALACIIGSQWGITGISWGTVVVSLIVLIVMMSLLKKMSLIGWKDYLQPQLPAMLAGIPMLISIVSGRYIYSQYFDYDIYIGLISLTILGAVIYLSIIYKIKNSELDKVKEEIFGSILKIHRKVLNSPLGRLFTSSNGGSE